MFKAVCLIRRRADMDREDFIHRYETGHAALCRRLIPGMRRYVRRYVQPGDTFLYEGAPDLDFDVVTELWFDDRQSYDDAMTTLGQSEAAQLLAADERALFDMASIRRFVVDERESVLVE